MTIRVALLGAGRIGQVHAEVIAQAKNATLQAVADPFPEAAQALCARTGARFDNTQALIHAEDVDAVLIATPTDTHADFIELAARAGKAVFCEKPIDLDAQRVRACLAVVAEHKARLMVGFNRRFDPHFMALKAALDAQQIGEIEQLIITSRDPAPPSMEYILRSGGLFRDMMIHDFDMARFLLGEEIDTVSATGSVLIDADIGGAGDVDTAVALLRTASGKQCVINNSRRTTYGYDQRIEVHGSRGMLSAENPRTDSLQWANESGYSRAPLHPFFMTRYTEAYANEIKAFVDWISDDSVLVPQGEDGLRSLLLADAANSAMESGAAYTVAQP